MSHATLELRHSPIAYFGQSVIQSQRTVKALSHIRESEPGRLAKALLIRRSDRQWLSTVIIFVAIAVGASVLLFRGRSSDSINRAPVSESNKSEAAKQRANGWSPPTQEGLAIPARQRLKSTSTTQRCHSAY